MRTVPYKPEVISGNIVAIGAFNPAIFTPDWLEHNGLIGSDDAEGMREAKNLVVSRQVTVLEGAAFSLQVDQTKFQANCKGVLTPVLRDLAIGIFQLVPHTPIRALGQNFDTLFRFFDNPAYHRVGDRLAPKSIWQRLYPEEGCAIGLASLTIKIQEGTREELQSNDCRNISVQHVDASFPAIRLSYNDHHDLVADRNGSSSAAEHAVDILRDTWEARWRESTRVFEQVIEMALGEQ